MAEISTDNKLTTLKSITTFNSLLNERIGKQFDFSCSMYTCPEGSEGYYQTILELAPATTYYFIVEAISSGGNSIFETGIEITSNNTISGFTTGDFVFGVSTYNDKYYLVCEALTRTYFNIKVLADSSYTGNWNHSCKSVSYESTVWLSSCNVLTKRTSSSVDPSTATISTDSDGKFILLTDTSGYVTPAQVNNIMTQYNSLVDRVIALEGAIYWEEGTGSLKAISIVGVDTISRQGTYPYTVVPNPSGWPINITWSVTGNATIDQNGNLTVGKKVSGTIIIQAVDAETGKATAKTITVNT